VKQLPSWTVAKLNSCQVAKRRQGQLYQLGNFSNLATWQLLAP
jgi:hypothetical protein